MYVCECVPAFVRGVPFMEGLTNNRYIGRMFIQPDQCDCVSVYVCVRACV